MKKKDIIDNRENKKIFEKLNFKPYPKILNQIFKKNGFEIRFVGGCIRDAILNKEIHDIDFSTNAKPDDVQKILKQNNVNYFNSGIKHGTITAVFDKTCYEITTLRIDNVCDGRHATVEFTDSWEEDAKRRDFTFNALYMDFEGQIYDFFDGISDLENKTLNFIGSSFERISEDYLRILRALRFFNRYCENGLENGSFASLAIKQLSHNLVSISGERISSETIKIFEDSFELKHLKNLEKFNELEVGKFIFMKDGKMEFKILYEILDCNYLSKMNAINKIALVLKENSIDPLLINQRWRLSKKTFNLLKEIFELKISSEIFEKPKKYIYLNYEILPEMIFWLKFKFKNFNSLITDIFCREFYGSNFGEILKNIDKIQKPIFPIDAKFLIENHNLLGQAIGVTLNHLEHLWLEANCEMTKENLVKNI